MTSFEKFKIFKILTVPPETVPVLSQQAMFDPYISPSTNNCALGFKHGLRATMFSERIFLYVFNLID